MPKHSSSFSHSASYHQGHPDPHAYRPGLWKVLNGAWDFCFDPNNRGEIEHWESHFPKEHQIILVPFPYQCPASGIVPPKEKSDILYYHRLITIESLKRHYLLTFYGVDHDAKIYVNGILLAVHSGGYDRFHVDITSALHLGENDLTLRIEDPMDSSFLRGKQRWRSESWACYYTETSGIVRDVLLEEVGESYLEDFLLIGDKEGGIRFKAKAHGAGKPLSLKLLVHGESEASYSLPLQEGEGEASFLFPNPRLWDGEDPYLYDAEILLLEQGKEVDRIETYLGFRSWESKEGKLWLNGKPRYLKFVLDQGYYPGKLTSPEEEDMKEALDKIVDYGFNGLRKHETVEPPLYYYYLDKMGLYSSFEIPSPYSFDERMERGYFAEMPRLIEQHLSYPSLFLYVLFNESWGVSDIAFDKAEQSCTIRAYQVAKSLLGPGLFCVGNDGWEHTKTDVLTLHNYAETYEELDAIYRPAFQTILKGGNPDSLTNYKKFFAQGYSYHGEPIFFSEFGGIAFQKDTESKDNRWGYGGGVKSEEEYLSKLADQIRWLKDQPQICGFCLTQLSDVEQEVNGLLDKDYKPKVASSSLAKLLK